MECKYETLNYVSSPHRWYRALMLALLRHEDSDLNDLYFRQEDLIV